MLDDLTKDLKKAKAACDKLNAYVGGLPKNSEPTAKYYELKRKANEAVKKLPKGLRSRFVIETFG